MEGWGVSSNGDWGKGAKNLRLNVTENGEKRDLLTERSGKHKKRWIFNERKEMKKLKRNERVIFFSLFHSFSLFQPNSAPWSDTHTLQNANFKDKGNKNQ